MTYRNVLVLAYYFPPMGLSGVQRITKFVKYLPEFGWKPHVVTTGPVAYYAHDESLLEDIEGRDVAVYRTAGKDPNSLLARKGTIRMPREIIRKTLSRISNTLFIPDNKKGWAKQAMTIAREIIARENIDVIFVSGPPFSAMIAGAQLAEEFGIPLVVDYRDLWYGNQFTFYPTPWHAHQNKEKEFDVLKHASRVTVTNRRMKEVMITNYPHLAFDDVIIVPHGYDSDDFSASSRSSESFTLTYTGTFYDFVTPRFFFRAVAKFMKEHPTAPLELHFAGILRDEYVKIARRLGIADRIVHHGYLPHRESTSLLQSSTALWMMVGNVRNADTVSSGKLYEYFGSRKPLLVSVGEGALRKDAERYGASWITQPDDVDAIAQSIAEIYAHWRKGTLPTPNEDVVQGFHRRAITDNLARVLAMATRVS